MNEKAIALAKEWLEDIPQQFHGKHNIEVLIMSYAKQFSDLIDAFDSLKSRVAFDEAIGKSLDGIGDILSLPREKAYTIVRGLRDANIDDDLYRKLLRFQALKSSSECTYYDLVNATHMLWDAEGIRYTEPEGMPATIEMKVPDISVDTQDPLLNRAISIKPAGVNVFYKTNYLVYQYHEASAANVSRIDIFSDFYFDDCEKLNGSWLLDGKVLLNQEPKGIEVHITESEGDTNE